ncbi:hypothetical protein MASR2M78_15850 [Treponema sp.]
MNAEESIACAKAYFMDKDEVKLALVYGSVLTERFNEHSDVDIAIAGKQAFDRNEFWDMAEELSVVLGRKIDLIDLNLAEGLILYRAMVDGKRIKTDPELAVRFSSKALGYKEDFKPLQDMIRDAHLRSFIDGR